VTVSTVLPDLLQTGILSARPAANTVPNGALYAATDAGVVYQSDGSGTWNVWASLVGAASIDTLTDVDTSTTAPTTSQVLTWDGTDWVPATPTSGGMTDPTTTKGDLIVHGATTTRFAVGADGSVLMADAAQTLGVKYKALDDSDVAPVAPNDQTGTTYTFALADGRRLVTASNASAQTYTVPPNSSVAYPLGTVLTITAKGAGQITLAPGAGVTLNSAHGLKTSAQWAVVSLTKILTDTWVVSGDTTT
jgi:hypothetical protein